MFIAMRLLGGLGGFWALLSCSEFPGLCYDVLNVLAFCYVISRVLFDCYQGISVVL